MLGNDRKSENPSTCGRNGFLQNVRGLSLLDKDERTDVHKSLNIEPLLLRIERSQLRWYGHVTRMSHEQTEKQLMDALSNDKRLRGRPKSRWRNYAEDLAWSCPGNIPERNCRLLQEIGMLGDFKLELLPRNPKRTSGKRKIH